MIADDRLLSVLYAADASDWEDVVLRTLLVTALKESGIDLTELSRGRIQRVLTLCDPRWPALDSKVGVPEPCPRE
jgi:hypothetical protein